MWDIAAISTALQCHKHAPELRVLYDGPLSGGVRIGSSAQGLPENSKVNIAKEEKKWWETATGGALTGDWLRNNTTS
jgi:hypothetical protein